MNTPLSTAFSMPGTAGSSMPSHNALSAGGAGSGTPSTALSAFASPSILGAGSASIPQGAPSAGAGAAPAPGPDILERARDKTRTSEIALSALAFLFAEVVSYTQSRSTGITDLEQRLSLLGYHVGQRILLLLTHREQTASNPKAPKRETKLLPVLLWIHTNFWKAAFGKAADSLEKSTEHADEYMISTNVPLFTRSISIPKDMSQLSVEAYTAGMVEAVLDGLGFPGRVTAHSVPTAEHPHRTTILIKLDKDVLEREEALS
ncbi:Trafficking protein particle complex subunit 31 [Tilletia horrida]|nr:Trafficking protein particle complex subunit 31 [Tilletia horrida]